MKSQRRHELQTNELADVLGRYVKAAAPYQNLILFGGLGVVALIVAGVYFVNQNRAAAAAGWTDYFTAVSSNDAESLEEVAQIHGDRDAAQWSRVTAGDINLATGASMRLTDKKEAEKKLKDAAKDYGAVIETAAAGSMILQRARFGLAQTHESLCELEEAQQLYEQVAQANPETELGKVALTRSEELGRKSTKGWYAWFNRQELQPPAMPAGSGELPDPAAALDPLSQRPDIVLPGAEDASVEDASAGDASAEDASAEDASVEDASVEDASVEDASAEDASAGDASAEDASAEGTTAEDTTAEDSGSETEAAMGPELVAPDTSESSDQQ